MEKDYTLLTKDEVEELPIILLRRKKFKRLIQESILNSQDTFSNCLCLQGKPGTGKTTLIVEHLTKLMEQGIISKYVRVTGHVTPTSLYNLLKEHSSLDNSGKITVTVLDDVDALYDAGSLEIMKAAFDTKNNHPDNRRVYYLARLGQNSMNSVASQATKIAGSFVYKGYCIIITNNDLTVNPTPHQEAVIDRIHIMNTDFDESDFKIFNTYIVQKYLRENPDGLSESILDQVYEFYKTEVKEWFDNNVFIMTNTLFSIRLIQKFIDLIKLFGVDWKEFSLPYKKLSNMNKLVNSRKIAN